MEPAQEDVVPQPESVLTTANSKSDLDKFKRRLIRAVARLVIHEKKPEKEVWEQLKVETKCDCQQVWHRMKCLTMKKLIRLLAADDVADNMPVAARMSLSDWLMFDLVLVHEKMDVIDKDRVKADTEDNKPLKKLFELVQKHKIEDLKGCDLAEAWSKITLSYNNGGRQCSPMLMQLRWYQLKELTRLTFYNFWTVYRGNSKNLNAAQIQHQPTKLMMAIAKWLPTLVTTEFMEWEERVENRLVILPEEFDEKIRAKGAAPDGTPDIVLMEPVVETIGVDSDSEQDKYHTVDQDTNESTEPEIHLKVKSEPINLESEDEEMEPLAESHIDEDSNENNTEAITQDLHEMLENADDESNQSSAMVTDEEGLNAQPISAIDGDDDNSNLPLIASISGNVNETGEPPILTHHLQNQDTNRIVTPRRDDIEDAVGKGQIIKPIESKSSDDDTDSDVTNAQNVKISSSKPINLSIDDIIKQKAEKFMEEQRIKKISNMESIEKPTNALESSMVKRECNIVPNTLLNVPTDFDYNQDDIEFVDDGIDIADDDEDIGEFACVPVKDEPEHSSSESNSEDQNEVASNNFDLKLLMQPLVYTTRLDDIKSTEIIDFISLKGMTQIDFVLSESKPLYPNSFSADTVNIKEEKKEDNDNTNEELLDTNIDETSNDELEIDDLLRVELSSKLLQKPIYRTYDPIKLCKNPDFNTRLKRLNIGFYGYTRNIQQLKTCKPMTIDLSKQFETKLVNGTLFLKSDTLNASQKMIPDQNVYEYTASVVPSAIPVQSLMNNIDALPRDQIDSSNQPTVSNERNKVINLPDITEIRRINQRLLTAEVTPVQIGDKTDTQNRNQAASASNVHKHVIPLLNGNDKIITPNNVAYVDQIELLRNNGKKKNNLPSWIDTSWVKKQTYPRPTRHVELSWLPKNKKVPKHDYLLAQDTLNKMLSLMNQEIPLQTKKKKNNKKKEDDPRSNSPEKSEVSDTTPSIYKPLETVEVAKEHVVKEQVKQANRPSRKKFCCWAREKMAASISKSRTRKHKCGTLCMCCCRFLLLQKLKIIPTENSNSIVLSDDEECEKVHETIESVVQESREIARTQLSSEPEGNPDESHKSLPNQSDKTDISPNQVVQRKHSKYEDNLKITVNNFPKHVEPQMEIEIETLDSSQSNAEKMDDLSTIDVSLSDTSPTKSQTPIPRINITIKPQSSGAHAKSHINTYKNIRKPTRKCSITIPPPLIKVRHLNKTSGATLLIDGTRKQPKINTIPSSDPKKRVLVMNSKSMMKRSKQCPIYLGENKILLTNMSFPPDLEEQSNEIKSKPQLQCNSPVGVPTGVNIKLMPNGDLTYTVSPETTLSDEEMAVMPELLKHLKSQLSAHGIKVNNENKLPDETSENKSSTEFNIEGNEATNLESQNVNVNTADATQTTTVEESTGIFCLPENENCKDFAKQVDTAKGEKGHSECLELLHDVVKDQTNQIEIQVENDNPKEIECSSTADSCRKSLLSDLMEMSGISAEDTISAPVLQEVSNPEVSLPPTEDEDLESQNCNQNFVPKESSVMVNKVTASGIKPITLTAVTSLKQLKYASLHGGKFFKLDTITGAISPINVNVSVRSNPLKANKAQPAVTDAVIDLTDEVESTIPKESLNEHRKHTPNILNKYLTAPRSLLRNVREMCAEQVINPVRPIRLIKSNFNRNNLKLNKHLEASQIASSEKLLAKAKAKKIQDIDSVCNDDDNIIEEYLIDESLNEETSESSESSDDEPLSTVAKRIKLLDDPSYASDHTSKPMETNEVEYLDEEMIEQSSDPHELHELVSDNSEEDCILGV